MKRRNSNINETRKPTKFVANGVGKDLSAFDCMMSNIGDVAFVDLKKIEKSGKYIGQINKKKINLLTFIQKN